MPLKLNGRCAITSLIPAMFSAVVWSIAVWQDSPSRAILEHLVSCQHLVSIRFAFADLPRDPNSGFYDLKANSRMSHQLPEPGRADVLSAGRRRS